VRATGVDAGIGLGAGGVGGISGRVGGITAGRIDGGAIVIVVAATRDDGGRQGEKRGKGQGKEN